MGKFSNIAGYKFVTLTNLRMRRARLLAFCKSWELKGSILLSTEGINLFVAGAPEKIDLLLAELRAIPGLENFAVKISPGNHQPFNRMLVRIKKEIIAFGVEGINPAEKTSPKLSPRILKQWLDEGRTLTLLDTRNDYEIKLGTFHNARTMGIRHFREFPEAARHLPENLKEQPIVLFCTGGIRCEKAGPFLEREGFKNIFQLEGGILKYFEDCGAQHYDGECFVFDQRVGVDPSLHETDSTQCFACQTPLSHDDQQSALYVPGKSCPYCFKTPEEQVRENIARRHDIIRRVTQPLPGCVPYDSFQPVNVPQDCEGASVVDFLHRVVPHLSRDYWISECEKNLILNVAKEPVSPNALVHVGERYLHKFPNVVEPPVNPDIQILHEDEALIVIHKPAPLPMHAGGRFYLNSLQNFLNHAYHPQKPHPAHRLDANTTGIILLTRTRYFASRLQTQFERGKVGKIYLAQVRGQPREETFFCDAPISDEAREAGLRAVDFENGLSSRTEFRVLEKNPDGTALIECRPLTGRTNQIRVHLWHLGFPIVGDPAYLPEGKWGETQTLSLDAPPLRLHAWKISFAHPLTRERVTFSTPPPAWRVP